MTERNDGPRPQMSRMRFSWQRQGEEPPSGDPEPRPWELGPDHEDQPRETGGATEAPPSSTPPSTDPWGEPEPRPGAAPLTPEPSVTQPPAATDTAPRRVEVEAEPPQVTSFDDAPRRSPEDARQADVRPAPRSKRGREQSGKDKARRTSGGDFTVPPPGGRFSGGRGGHAAIRVGLILTTCILALVVVGYVAFSYGISSVRDTTYRLSEADIRKYQLSEFPLTRAGQFAADYARLCLSHPADEAGIGQREQELRRLAASGTTSSCGWNGQGQQTVLDATWTGESEPMESGGYGDKARWLSVQVLTDAGSRVVTVPVYVANLEAGNGLRVVGDVGEMPQPTLAKVPEAATKLAVDQNLSNALLDGQFFGQFFGAWASTDSASLQRLVTPDATQSARNGLAGALQEPRVRKAEVFLPDDVEANTSYSWERGAVTEAWVWVTWRNKAADGTETSSAIEERAYRLQLVKTTEAESPTQEWTIRDVRGGVPLAEESQ